MSLAVKGQKIVVMGLVWVHGFAGGEDQRSAEQCRCSISAQRSPNSQPKSGLPTPLSPTGRNATNGPLELGTSKVTVVAKVDVPPPALGMC